MLKSFFFKVSNVFLFLIIIMPSLSYQKKILANGARTILVPMPWTEAVTLLVLFGVGSRFETPKLNGASHFIEHMMFKGTDRRPTTLDIARELDRVGAEYNAFTAKNHTGYWITVSDQHLDLALDVLFDMLLHSKFNESEIERERRVILEEIKMYEENPLLRIDDLFEGLLFEGSALGQNIAGTKESMAKINRSHLLNYKNCFYGPKNAVIAAAGKIDKTVFKKIEWRASDFIKCLNKRKSVKRFHFKKTKPVRLYHQSVDQAQLALGFPAYSYFDKKMPALKLLNVILGGNMSSRLFIEVREKRGLAYFVRSEIDSFFDTGSLKIRAGLDASRIEEAIKVILNELSKICAGVSDNELQDAKEFLRGRLVLSLEDSAEQAIWCGKQELLTGKILTLREKIKEFEKVTLKEIKIIANDIIKKDYLRCALIGPWKDENKFIKFLKL